KKEIELKDVKYEEFLNLLHVICPSEMEITARCVLPILTLADQFEMRNASKNVEIYLMNTTKF
ncbi:hypothetical protein PFISCL1PPCAC_20944, partial [Pristionchus fissidentatus]